MTKYQFMSIFLALEGVYSPEESFFRFVFVILSILAFNLSLYFDYKNEKTS